MFDGTVLLHDLLGSLWRTINLTALIHHDKVEIPFDPQLKVFLNQHEGKWNQLIAEIRRFCDVPPEMMEREGLYSPWKELSPTSTSYDARGVTIEIILATKEYEWIEIDFANQGEVQQLAQKALAPCLRRIIPQLLTMRHFFTGSESYEPQELETCLLPLEVILGSAWQAGSATLVQSLLDHQSTRKGTKG